MARVTDLEVGTIIDTTGVNDVGSFIGSAGVMVDAIPMGVYVDPILKQIELYLSAHLIAVSNPHLGAEREQKDDDVTSLLLAESGQGLASTVYGQAAAQFDAGGHLAGNNVDGVGTRKRTVSVTAV